jgi:hypothetical protein
MSRTFHFAAFSTADFDQAISALETEFGLGPFDRDVEDTWEYATALLPGDITLNLTRTSGTDTIASWLPSAPTGVNWQVIVGSDSDPEPAQASRVRQAIEQVLGASLTAYHAA